MGLYQRKIVPCVTHLAMSQAQLLPYRRRIVGAAEGRVLEIGAGSGLNLALYGSAVGSVIALEPSAALLGMARARARVAPVPVAILDASAEAIPLDAGSINTVVTTWTLCTIADASRALSEIRRVLRPGGSVLFVEHGRAPEARIARWQDRLDPLWAWLTDGCHLNRKIDDLLKAAGFRITALQNSRLSGPSTHSYLYEGRARPT